MQCTDVSEALAHGRSRRCHRETAGTPTVDAQVGGGSTPSLTPGVCGRHSPRSCSTSFATRVEGRGGRVKSEYILTYMAECSPNSVKLQCTTLVN